MRQHPALVVRPSASEGIGIAIRGIRAYIQHVTAKLNRWKALLARLRLLPESRLQVGTAAEQLERLHSRHSRRFSHRQMQPKNSPHPFNRSDRSRSVYGEPERAEECQRTVEGTSEREREYATNWCTNCINSYIVAGR